MFYTDYEDLFERFSIMDDGKTDINKIFDYLKNNTTEVLFEKLQKEVAKKHINKNPLCEYLQNNIALYPCNQDARPLVKIYGDQHTQLEESKIKDVETLENWNKKGVSVFSFYPIHNNLIVLDLDNSNEHANTTNGIENFKKLIASINLSEQNKNNFFNFPANFPCYVETPHNGLHLYFKSSYIPDNWTPNKTELDKLNIEIKYNTQVTAGGSLRNGKKYIFHGEIKDAPRMTTDLIELLTKVKPVQMPVQKYKTNYMKDGTKWNTTPDGIINKAMEIYSNLGNHEFIYKTAVLFRNAGFTKEIATEYITKTPQHLGRKNQADTTSAINSVF